MEGLRAGRRTIGQVAAHTIHLEIEEVSRIKKTSQIFLSNFSQSNTSRPSLMLSQEVVLVLFKLTTRNNLD